MGFGLRSRMCVQYIALALSVGARRMKCTICKSEDAFEARDMVLGFVVSICPDCWVGLVGEEE